MWCTAILSLIVPSVAGTFENELDQCLSQIMTQYFGQTSMLVFDGRNFNMNHTRSLLPADGHFQMDRVLSAIIRDGNRVVEVNNQNHREMEIDRYKIKKLRTSIFVFDDDQIVSWPIIDDLFRQIKNTEYWHRQGRTLIIAPKTHPGFNNSIMAQNAIAGIWRWNKAVNVAVMIAEEYEFSFYIWFPYRQPYCRWVYPQPVHDTWRNGQFVHGKSLYPAKIKRDFEGCPLRICSSDCVPYTYDNYTKGFEAKLINQLSKYFNFSMLKVDLPKGEDIWTTKSANGTIVGAFGQLDIQKVDLTYACIMLNVERYNLGESLPTYFHDSLSWFVPTPDLKSHASNILEAFPAQYWIIIVITTLAALTTFLLIHKLEDYALSNRPPQSLISAGLRVFAMALSSPFTTTSRSWLLRALTFAFAIYSLHITTVYQAALYNLYKSNSYTNVYNTLEDAINNGLFVWLRASTKHMYNPNDGIWKKIMQNGRHDYLKGDLETPFDQVAIEKSAILLFIKTTMLTYIKEYYMDENRRPMMLYLSEQFTSYPVTTFLSPGHPVYRQMCIVVHWITDAGMINHWLDEVIHFKDVEAPPVNYNLSLKLEHISGAFMFYAVLITIAAGVFLLEIIYWLTHGRTMPQPLGKDERILRRQILFRAVVDLSRDRVISRWIVSDTFKN